VTNPYPHPVYLDPKAWMGMMTLCTKEELDNIRISEGKDKNIFEMGGGRRSWRRGVNGVSLGKDDGLKLADK
jgi:hypothetical protein